MSDEWSYETEHQLQCPVCSGSGKLLYSAVEDYYFGSPGSWPLWRCSAASCRTVWINPRPTEQSIGHAYTNYYTHAPAPAAHLPWSGLSGAIARAAGLASARQDLYFLRVSQLPPGRLLDVGCGNGQRLGAFRKLGWQVVGQEVDPEAAQVASNAGHKVFVGPLAEVPRGAGFDLILLNHVLEHVHDPAQMLQLCAYLLTPGGKVALLTPNASGLGHCVLRSRWRGLEVPRHLQVFTGGSLRRLIASSGLTPVVVDSSPINAQWFMEQWASAKSLPRTGTKLVGWIWQLLCLAYWAFDRESGDEIYAMAVRET